MAYGGINKWIAPQKPGATPWVSTRFSLSVEDKQADAGRDGRTRLARPISQSRTRTGEYSFSLFSWPRAGLATLPAWSIPCYMWWSYIYIPGIYIVLYSLVSVLVSYVASGVRTVDSSDNTISYNIRIEGTKCPGESPEKQYCNISSMLYVNVVDMFWVESGILACWLNSIISLKWQFCLPLLVYLDCNLFCWVKLKSWRSGTDIDTIHISYVNNMSNASNSAHIGT